MRWSGVTLGVLETHYHRRMSLMTSDVTERYSVRLGNVGPKGLSDSLKSWDDYVRRRNVSSYFFPFWRFTGRNPVVVSICWRFCDRRVYGVLDGHWILTLIFPPYTSGPRLGKSYLIFCGWSSGNHILTLSVFSESVQHVYFSAL